MSRTYKDVSYDVWVDRLAKKNHGYVDHDHVSMGRTVEKYTDAELNGETLEDMEFCSKKNADALRERCEFLQGHSIQYHILDVSRYSLYRSTVLRKFKRNKSIEIPGNCKENRCEHTVRVNPYALKERFTYADRCTAGENLVYTSGTPYKGETEDGFKAPCTPQAHYWEMRDPWYNHRGYCYCSGKVEHWQRARLRDLSKKAVNAYNTTGETDEDLDDMMTYNGYESCFC